MTKLQFYINDRRVDKINSFSFSGGLSQPVRNISIGTQLRNEAFIGDLISISDDAGNVYASGMISQERELLSRSSGYGISLTGKNFLGFLIRDEAFIKEYEKVSLGSIVKEILSQSNIFGQGINIEVESSEESFIVSKFAVEDEESALDSCVRLTARRGLYCYYTPHNNTIHFKKIKTSGNTIKTFDFDSDEGVDADISVDRNITDSSTDFSFNNDEKKTKEKTLIQSSVDLENPVVNASANNTVTNTILAIDPTKYAKTIDSQIIAENFANRAYSTLCSYHTAPPDNGTFRSFKYGKVISDDMQSSEEQIEKQIRDNMPTASVTLSFDHIELGLLNGVYKIKSKDMKINDTFILSGFSASMTTGDAGKSQLTFTRLGYFK